MTWIQTIAPDHAEGRLAKTYRRVAGPDGQVDNILQAHSLRPHSLDGHMALYKNVLHHSANQLPKALLEGLGVYVSLLNRCDYCVVHHAEGFRRNMNDPAAAEAILTALRAGRPEDALGAAESALYRYAETLTRDPSSVTQEQIQGLRGLGWDDGEILEANQVIAYFGYANRTVLGLGVSPDGETLGLSPGDGGDDSWGHG